MPYSDYSQGQRRAVAIALNVGFLTLLLLGTEFDITPARIAAQTIVWGCLLLYAVAIASGKRGKSERMRPVALYVAIDVLAIVLMLRASWYLSSVAYVLSVFILEIRYRGAGSSRPPRQRISDRTPQPPADNADEVLSGRFTSAPGSVATFRSGRFMVPLTVLLTHAPMVMNLMGGVLALVWLVLLGEWSVIGYGLILMIGMPLLFALADLPGNLPLWAGLTLLDRGWRILAIGFLFVSSLWTSALIVVWCTALANAYIHLAIDRSLIPVLLWGYTVATSPLSYMASRDRFNIFTSLHAVLTQLYFGALVLCWALDGPPVAYAVLAAIALFTFPLLGLLLGAANVSFNRKAPAGTP